MATTRPNPKRTRKKKKCPLPDFLPDEIIVEILLRSPVKSLIRFKCVCKSWRSLISDPQFIKKHLSLSSSEEGLENWRIILRYPYHGLKSCSLYSVFHEPFGYSVDLDFPMRDLRGEVNIIGSCNGLVCFSIKQKRERDFVFFWNPSTRESKRLPFHGDRYNPSVIYEFGYSEVCDDYKVIKLILLESVRPPMEIYSLRSDSWKKIEDFPFAIHSIEAGVVVNGALHWGVDRDSDNSWAIVSFDLAEEKYAEIPQPDYGGGKFNPLLRVLEGRLCILCDRSAVCVDIWMMKEYGQRNSWTKLVTVPYSNVKHLQFPRSLCYLKYGAILMYFGRTLIMYDIEGKTFKFPVIYGVQDCHEANIFIESLVSPNAFKGTGFDLNKEYDLEDEVVLSLGQGAAEVGE